MNLGGGAAMVGVQPQGMVSQVQPMGMQIPGMGMSIASTVSHAGSAGMGIGAFSQPAGTGHTLATNLWQ
jgi:hypothetical protein